MAWSTPTSRAAGYVVPHTVWNSDVVDNPIALRAGAIAISSQTTGDVIVASSSSQFGRVAPSTAGHVLTSNGAGVAPSFQAQGQMLLLKANSGSTTTTSAENVDTYAMASALTAKDTVIVEVTYEVETQALASMVLYNSTDSVTITGLWDTGVAATIAAGKRVISTAKIRQLQAGATSVAGYCAGKDDDNGTHVFGGFASFTTNWTGAWTLALRQGGLTAGGTLRWSWSVYKLAGQ